jgi:hypothetical protein
MAEASKVNYYKARTDDELRKQAETQYKSYYDQLRRAAQQKSERETTALEGQRAGIQRNYQRQLDESAKQYREAYSQTDRETLRRGMQRSSYAAQRLANVNQQGLEAAQKIREAQGDAEGNLDAQIAQISGQLADTLAGYDANQANDIMNRYNELQNQEYDRNREAQQFAESIRQWQTQFDESVRQFNQLHPQSTGGGGGGGGYSGGGGRGGGGRGGNGNNGKDNTGSLLDRIQSALNGGDKGLAATKLTGVTTGAYNLGGGAQHAPIVTSVNPTNKTATTVDQLGKKNTIRK